MSSYEQYDKTAAHYDRARWPIGAEIIVGCLAQGRARLATMTVLDARRGTGNHGHPLLPHLARIEVLARAAGASRTRVSDLAAVRLSLLDADWSAIQNGVLPVPAPNLALTRTARARRFSRN
jgi:hypothetical protein